MSSEVIEPGSRIGAYEVVDVLGYGGMGVVYRVRERIGGVSRLRALKTVLPRHARKPEIIRRFREEAEKMCLLEHENIVPVLHYGDVGDDGETPFIVMPFIVGHTLREHLQSRRRERGTPGIAVDEALHIAHEVGQALDAAHRVVDPETGDPQPIVHRDVKPANVMICPDPKRAGRIDRVLVMDFGIAKVVAGASPPDTRTKVIGTLDYAAPEQVQRRDIDPRADVYSLGIVLYELCCGRTPLDGMNEHDKLRRLRPDAGDLELRDFPAEIPESLRSVIRRSVAFRPDDRFPDMPALVAALRRVRDERAMERSRAVERERTEADVARRRALESGVAEYPSEAWTRGDAALRSAEASLEDGETAVALQAFEEATKAYRDAASHAASAVAAADEARRRDTEGTSTLIVRREDAASEGPPEDRPTEKEAAEAVSAAHRAFERARSLGGEVTSHPDFLAAAQTLRRAQRLPPEGSTGEIRNRFDRVAAELDGLADRIESERLDIRLAYLAKRHGEASEEVSKLPRTRRTADAREVAERELDRLEVALGLRDAQEADRALARVLGALESIRCELEQIVAEGSRDTLSGAAIRRMSALLRRVRPAPKADADEAPAPDQIEKD